MSRALGIFRLRVYGIVRVACLRHSSCCVFMAYFVLRVYDIVCVYGIVRVAFLRHSLCCVFMA